MFIATKINDNIKTKRCSHGFRQCALMSREDCLSLAPGFHALKHARAATTKENKDTGSDDLTSFFFRTEIDDDDEPMLLKLNSLVDLLLVDSNEE